MTHEERETIIRAMDKLLERLPPDMTQIYQQLYGDLSPTRNDVQTLRNRLNPNRSNPNLLFLGNLVQQFPGLKDLTLGELFKPDASSN